MSPRSNDGSVPRGYAVDHRPSAQVAKRAASPLGDFERLAARVIARLTGEVVFLQDDGTKDHMPDIRIEHLDRSPAYAEVWTDTDPRYAAMEARLMKPGNQLPLELTEPTLSRVWWISVSGATNIDRLQAEIGTILSELERAGITFERVGGLASYDDSRVARLVHHGVVRVSSRQCISGEIGMIRFHPAGISGSPAISWNAVVTWLRRTLSSARLDDVRSKLAATDATERHLFLGVTYSSPSDVFFALDDYDQSLPSEPPDLPREITHLWLMRASPAGRCIAWFPDWGWFDVSKRWATA